MNATGRFPRGSPLRFAWGLAWLLGVGIYLLNAPDDAAGGRTTCSYAGAPKNVVTVKVEGESVGEIVRRGDEIAVRSDDGPLRACAGGAATVTNTDTIKIMIAGLSFVDVDLSGGPFAPGLTPEAEGASEIEIQISPGDGAADVYGTAGADVWHWGPGGKAPGLNLNPRDAGDDDVDVTLTGAEGPIANGAAGDDTIIGAPGAAVRGLFSANGDAGNDVLGSPRFLRSDEEPAYADLVGGAGDDVLTGSATGDFLKGGAGADRVDGRGGDDEINGGSGRDRLLGGAGPDKINSRDSASDVVSCGPGRDRVTRDARDEVSGCERSGGR